jgi:hypothetical protein
MFDREMPVRMVVGVRLVGTPTVGPDLCRAQQLAAGAQNDAEGLIVKNERQACHCEAFPVVGYGVATARA